MDHKTVEDFILSFDGAKRTYPFGEEVAVYKVPVGGDPSTGLGQEEKMFALIQEKSDPVNLSVKCDPQLAELLREKYVTVMPGYHLNKKHWNTIVLSGELPWEEIQGFIRHSYQLVTGSES